jgi:hypothetical protein
VARGAEGFEFQTYAPRGRPDVTVVAVHMDGVEAEVKRWLSEHPDATDEEINEAHWLAAGNREHWSKGAEHYPEESRFMFFEVNDSYEIVGPSPGPVEDGLD